MKLALLGTVNIRAQLDSAYWGNIQQHNDTVTKNKYVLLKIIDCIKFCGTESSQNPGICCGLINFSAELDTTLNEYIKMLQYLKELRKKYKTIYWIVCLTFVMMK
ncbi:unnamed protein product [Acanthoscelides obtectus]|uniref:Uncharacterized protein n=1 Tax=Acanthoscelides obtectus TaxID=200917 RepID=A0A9P0M4C1_ACAOB|nr:unnamed protein product [Acanthoscelides obtectus]CAK1666828.1 hypothetical protein AOBTE_LOCUS25504 [Acanthoscelides obtectus]